jgi:hypothetical protein
MPVAKTWKVREASGYPLALGLVNNTAALAASVASAQSIV